MASTSPASAARLAHQTRILLLTSTPHKKKTAFNSEGHRSLQQDMTVKITGRSLHNANATK
eukprot:scaffold246895_cov19-Prasinocladus_malaysianus.AAC.1